VSASLTHSSSRAGERLNASALPSSEGARSRPWISLLLTGVVLAIALLGLEEAAEFRRSATREGELWRLLTSHFSHFGWNHLVWDLAVFGVLGAVVERTNRRTFLHVLLWPAILIPLAVGLGEPSITHYRGLSGLDSALAAFLGMTLVADRTVSPTLRTIAFLSLGGLAVKILVEWTSGSTIFVDHVAAGFHPVPIAHLVGGAVGAGVAVVAWSQRRPSA
jgi:rhomboid family GlyGly-CTERM serine protease